MTIQLMTLSIYLDSNDYSRFAELSKQSQAVQGVFEALTNWVAEGRVVVRYSSVNVIEAAPLTYAAIPKARERFETIYRLCGKHCLIDVMRLLKTEASLGASVPAVSDIGDWHPVVHDLDIPDAATIARTILDKAKGAATSAQMKKYEAQFFDKRGKLRDSARPRIVDFRNGIGALPFMQYPISPGALETYFAFLLGRATRRQLTVALIDSFADLNRWGEWYEKAWEVAHPITRGLRDPAEKLADDIRRLSAMLKVFFNALNVEGRQAKDVQRRFNEKSNPDAMSAQLLAQVSRGITNFRPRGSFSWSATPAFETYSTVAMQVVRDSAIQVGRVRQTLDSDFVDCLHLCYAPFVDIIRADAYMVGVVDRCKLPIQTQFVARIEDLPSVISSHSSFNERS